MTRQVQLDGAALKRERELRGLTQEELSEMSQVGVRTLRRLEAGYGSVKTLRRVREVFDLEPVPCPELEACPKRKAVADALYHEPLSIELSMSLAPLIEKLLERLFFVRQHIAREIGLILPSVRVRDSAFREEGSYEIRVHGLRVAGATLALEKHLAVGSTLDLLEGEPTTDPTYAMPAKWIDPCESSAELMVFDHVSIVATQFTEMVRRHAAKLVGIEETFELLEITNRPRLVDAVIPSKVEIVTLRNVLRRLLEERVSIRPLVLILEALADAKAQESCAQLTERARAGLGARISSEYANSSGELKAVTWGGEPDLDQPEFLEQARTELENLWTRGLEAILIAPRVHRRNCWERLSALGPVVVLAEDEVVPRFEIRSVATIGT